MSDFGECRILRNAISKKDFNRKSYILKNARFRARFRRRHFAGFEFSPAAFRRARVFAGPQFCGRLQIEGPPAGKPKKPQKVQNRRQTSDRRTPGRKDKKVSKIPKSAADFR